MSLLFASVFVVVCTPSTYINSSFPCFTPIILCHFPSFIEGLRTYSNLPASNLIFPPDSVNNPNPVALGAPHNPFEKIHVSVSVLEVNLVHTLIEKLVVPKLNKPLVGLGISANAVVSTNFNPLPLTPFS